MIDFFFIKLCCKNGILCLFVLRFVSLFIKIAQEVEAKVLDLDLQLVRINLSLKRMQVCSPVIACNLEVIILIHVPDLFLLYSCCNNFFVKNNMGSVFCFYLASECDVRSLSNVF